jgi:hypothetical protein
MTVPTPQPLSIDINDERFLARIGNIVVAWACAESILAGIIAGLIGTGEDRIWPLTTFMTGRNQMDAVKVIAKLSLEPRTNSVFEQRLKTLSGLAGFRNKVVHGLWIRTNDPDIVQLAAIKARGKVTAQTEWVNLFYLEWLAVGIQAAGRQLMEFAIDEGLIPDPDPDYR